MISTNKSYFFLAGLTIGAVGAAIYSPQSGAATRKRIGQAIDDAGDSIGSAGEYLRGQADRFNAEAQATIAHTRTQVQGVLNQAGEALNTTVKQAGEAFGANSDLASAAIKAALAAATGQPLK